MFEFYLLFSALLWVFATGGEAAEGGQGGAGWGRPALAQGDALPCAEDELEEADEEGWICVANPGLDFP